MKVLPALLRKGKSPAFLKPRPDDKRNSPAKQQDGSFPSFGSTAACSDDYTIEHPSTADEPKMCHESSSDFIPSTIDILDVPPILPTISYPPLSEEPIPVNLNSLQSHYQYANQTQNDAYGGIKKYYSNTHETRKYYGSERPAGSFEYYDAPLEKSPIGVDQFESLAKFHGLKRDVSLLGMRRNTSTASESSSLLDGSTSSNGIAALEELTKSQEPDVYMEDDDTCDMDFSRDSEDSSEAEQVTLNESSDFEQFSGVESATEMGEASALAGESSALGGTADSSKSSTLEGTKVEEDETAFFSECEYDTNAEENHDLAAMYEIRKEIKVTTLQHGDLDTIDEHSQSSYSQFNDEESMASSYMFSLVDDGADVLKMKRRRKARQSRRARRQQKQGPLFSQSLMDSDGSDLLQNDESNMQHGKIRPTEDPDGYEGCPCSLSFAKMKEDMKNTYADATKAINQVMYAFFVVEDDINAMADKIRGAQFNEQNARKPERKFSKSVMV